MDNIDLFDKYIKGQLSKDERSVFEAKLTSDSDFAQEFKVYSTTVVGICREAEQDNFDFGKAMKSISKEQLREIVGPRHEDIHKTNSKRKILNFRPWMWQAASIAAVVIIAFTVVFRIDTQSRIAVDNAIYACNSEELSLWRSGAEQIDISKLDDKELNKKLSIIREVYEASTDEQEIADNGYSLAMAYIRLHERDNAKDILNQLIDKFSENESYQGFVTKCESILALIK